MTEKTTQAAKLLEAIYAEIDLFRRLSGTSTEATLYLGDTQAAAIFSLGGVVWTVDKEKFSGCPVVFVDRKSYLRMA